jgi:hypothetical protein
MFEEYQKRVTDSGAGKIIKLSKEIRKKKTAGVELLKKINKRRRLLIDLRKSDFNEYVEVVKAIKTPLDMKKIETLEEKKKALLRDPRIDSIREKTSNYFFKTSL